MLQGVKREPMKPKMEVKMEPKRKKKEVGAWFLGPLLAPRSIILDARKQFDQVKFPFGKTRFQFD